MAPLLAYLDATETMDPSRPTTVVLAEFVPRHLWEYPLHNQTALRLKLRLFWRPNTVVIDVPYHLTARTSRAGGVAGLSRGGQASSSFWARAISAASASSGGRPRVEDRVHLLGDRAAPPRGARRAPALR